MLPEVGATELIFLAAIALIVVGPKDLPVLMRKVGQWVAKMRGLAAEFRSSFDELARQSELDELRKEVEALPTDLGVQSSLDSENAYMTNWAASHATPTDTPPEAFLPGPPDLHALEPPTVSEISAQAEAAKPPPKPRAPRKPKAAAAVEAEPAAKPRRVAKPKAATAESGEAKPRARRAAAESKG